MILAVLSLAVSQCADQGFCPAREELLSALRAHQSAQEWKRLQAADEANPGDILFVTQRRILRITEVYCGAPYDGPPRTLNCRFTAQYPDGRTFYVATLGKDVEEWVIRDALSVFQSRKAGR